MPNFNPSVLLIISPVGESGCCATTREDNEAMHYLFSEDEEEKRTVREGLTEEGLTIFDLLCQKVAMSEKEYDEIKRIAKELLEKLQDVLVIDWRKKSKEQKHVFIMQ